MKEGAALDVRILVRIMASCMEYIPSYLDELDQLLLGQSDDCMLLTQLDGFLTGILVCPEMIPPSEWLKHVWAGEDGEGTPDFEDTAGFQHFIDLIMFHYNQILTSLNRPGEFEPVLETDTRNGDILWEMWIEGFTRAIDLAPEGWRRVADGDDAGCKAALVGIEALKSFYDGSAKLSRMEEDEWDREAPDLIPIWVEMLHAWRLENDPSRPSSVRRWKVGRNDPCPCGSGKKYKKCCGLN